MAKKAKPHEEGKGLEYLEVLNRKIFHTVDKNVFAKLEVSFGICLFPFVCIVHSLLCHFFCSCLWPS